MYFLCLHVKYIFVVSVIGWLKIISFPINVILYKNNIQCLVYYCFILCAIYNSIQFISVYSPCLYIIIISFFILHFSSDSSL